VALLSQRAGEGIAEGDLLGIGQESMGSDEVMVKGGVDDDDCLSARSNFDSGGCEGSQWMGHQWAWDDDAAELAMHVTRQRVILHLSWTRCFGAVSSEIKWIPRRR
jgi:hypothetical protein